MPWSYTTKAGQVPAQAGENTLRDVFEQAGFTQFRKAAENPTNLIIEGPPTVA